MDSRSTRLLWDLRAALLKAMAESQEMRRALDRLRENGWSAYVVIDEADDESETEAAAIAPTEPDEAGVPEMTGADLSLLRSLGIDPRPEPRGA